MSCKIALVFPGIGYTCKRPLLYYASQMAAEHGYHVISLDYGPEIHKTRERGPDVFEKLSSLAVDVVLANPEIAKLAQELDNKNKNDGEKRILMISKSIGTLVAARVESALFARNSKNNKNFVRHFMITPIPETLPYLESMNGVFLSGTSDPYISEGLVRDAAARLPQKAYLFEGCDHSLEHKGHTLEGLDNLRFTVALLDQFLIS